MGDRAGARRDARGAQRRRRAWSFLRRVEAWTDEVAAEFIAACLARAREHADESGSARVVAYARSAEKLSVKGPAMTGFVTAHAAGVRAVEADGSGYEDGRATEREWQSQWLATRLGFA